MCWLSIVHPSRRWTSIWEGARPGWRVRVCLAAPRATLPILIAALQTKATNLSSSYSSSSSTNLRRSLTDCEESAWFTTWTFTAVSSIFIASLNQQHRRQHGEPPLPSESNHRTRVFLLNYSPIKWFAVLKQKRTILPIATIISLINSLKVLRPVLCCLSPSHRHFNCTTPTVVPHRRRVNPHRLRYHR